VACTSEYKCSHQLNNSRCSITRAKDRNSNGETAYGRPLPLLCTIRPLHDNERPCGWHVCLREVWAYRNSREQSFSMFVSSLRSPKCLHAAEGTGLVASLGVTRRRAALPLPCAPQQNGARRSPRYMKAILPGTVSYANHPNRRPATLSGTQMVPHSIDRLMWTVHPLLGLR
jgi:hypothetical protein